MSLKLMYITNDPVIATIAESAGVDRIFVDLEKLGKQERQENMNSVKSDHSIDDISILKSVLSTAELLVRVNPINPNSKDEINQVIHNGADIVMLPMWKTVEQVKQFIGYVGGRAKVMLLLETKEADSIACDVVKLKGIDEIHIGLNDLHLSYNKTFMFELLTDGTVERLCKTIAAAGIPYGFGGIGRIGYGNLLAEHILCEHYRLRSSTVILSRSFCDAAIVKNREIINRDFSVGVRTIRTYEKMFLQFDSDMFDENKKVVKNEVEKIVESMVNR